MRTGSGKSQVSRYLSRMLRESGRKTAVIRHPMPYGDLLSERAQRFATREDLDAARCTMEEREEYEPHIAAGNVVYAGVDYAEILRRAEREAEILLWEGGNNDFPFVRPTVHVALADPLRPGHETTYHPGEAVLRMADIIVVNKTNIAAQVRRRAHRRVGRSAQSARRAAVRRIAGDGGHGGSTARQARRRGGRRPERHAWRHGERRRLRGSARSRRVIVDPRPYATGEIAETVRALPASA